MIDQPNRPAFRMTETTFAEIEALAETMFLDGLVTGMPIAKNVEHIVGQAVMFGRDEASRSDSLPWVNRFDNFADLTRGAVRKMIDGMFSNNGISNTLHSVTMMAVSYGFYQEQHRVKYSAVEGALALVLGENSLDNKVSEQATNAFLDELEKLMNARLEHAAIGYMETAINEHKIKFDHDAPKFKSLSNRMLEHVFRV